MKVEGTEVKSLSEEEVKSQYIGDWGGCQQCKSIKLQPIRNKENDANWQIKCLDCDFVVSITRHIEE